MKTHSTPEPFSDMFLRRGLPAGLVSLGLLVASLAPASALYIDFEQPAYTSGALLNGQAGWTAGLQNYVDTPPIAGAASAFVYAENSGAAIYSLASQEFASTTTFSGLVRANDPATYELPNAAAIILLTNTNSNTYLALWASNDNTFYYLNSTRTAWNSTGLTFNYGEVLSFTATLNFTSQTFDLTVNNQTSSASVSLNSLSFSDTTSISEASGLLQLGGQSASFDNLSIQPVPEPSTSMLLGLAIAGCVTLFVRRKSTAPIA